MDKGRTGCMAPHSAAGWSAIGLPLPPDTTSDSSVRLPSSVTWISLPQSQDSKGMNTVMEEIVYLLKEKRYLMYNCQRRDGQYVLCYNNVLCYSCISVVGKDRQQKYKRVKILQFIPSVFIPTLTVSNHLLVLLYVDNNVHFSGRQSTAVTDIMHYPVAGTLARDSEALHLHDCYQSARENTQCTVSTC